MTLVAHTLGTRLKAERESRGFTLVQVSASTKIPVTLLDALERNDLSRWPKGIYRRAFFRSYVTALGLRVEPLVVEFARVFPDEPVSAAAASESPDASPDAPSTELALAWAGPSTTHRTLRSAALALLEVASVVGAAGVIAWTAGVQLLAAIGAVAVVYYPAVRAAAGRGRTLSVTRSRASGAPRRVEPVALPDVSHESTAIPTRLTHVRAHLVERCRPVTARSIAAATGVMAPALTGTAKLLKVSARATGRTSRQALKSANALVINGGSAAARRLGHTARETGRVSAHALESASRVFWNGVRSAAEQAALLARRQLNRTRE